MVNIYYVVKMMVVMIYGCCDLECGLFGCCCWGCILRLIMRRCNSNECGGGLRISVGLRLDGIVVCEYVIIEEGG